jgi:hypothetical protein
MPQMAGVLEQQQAAMEGEEAKKIDTKWRLFFIYLITITITFT